MMTTSEALSTKVLKVFAHLCVVFCSFLYFRLSFHPAPPLRVRMTGESKDNERPPELRARRVEIIFLNWSFESEDFYKFEIYIYCLFEEF